MDGVEIDRDTTFEVTGDVVLTSVATADAVGTGIVKDTVCPGLPYTANGFNLLASATQTSGEFSRSVSTDAGCDSTVTLNLQVKSTHTITFHANGGTGDMPQQVVCDKENTILDNVVFAKEGFFFTGWATAAGGDVAYADGAVISTQADMELYAVWGNSCVDLVASHIANPCDSIRWRDTTLYSDCVYNDTIFGAVPGGCDSVYSLHLTVRHSSAKDYDVVACRPYTWVDGETYTENTDKAISLTNAVGCDSTMSLHLVMSEPPVIVDDLTVCDSLKWRDGITYYSSTDEPSILIHGTCDSTVHLHLTVNHSSYVDTSSLLCDGYDWMDGITHTNVYPQGNQYQCDSTVTVHLKVRHSTFGDTIAVACNTFTWREHTYTTSTSEPKHVFYGGNADGCDSTVTLRLTINYNNQGDTTVVACDTYSWYEHTGMTTTQNVSHLFPNGNQFGCDSTVTLHLTVNYSNQGDTSAVVCNTYDWYEHTGLTATQDVTHLFQNGNMNGCDSTVTLHLTVNYSCVGDTTAVACDSYDWYEHLGMTTTQDVTHLFQNGNMYGCDSTVTLHLTVNYSNQGDTTAVACNTYDWYEHTGMTTTQDVDHLFQNANQFGCDSTVTLHLTVNYSSVGDTTAIVCDIYDWYEHVAMTTTQDVGHIFQNANQYGCDSTVTLHLTVNYSNQGDTTAIACDTYDWYEHIGLTTTQDVDHIFQNGNQYGCDSTVTLHLTVNYSNQGDTTAIVCDTYDWYEHTGLTTTQDVIHLFQNGNVYGCDSTVTLHLTVNYSSIGDTTAVACDSYDWYEHTSMTTTQDVTHLFLSANQYGCDSTVTLHLTVNYSSVGDTHAVAYAPFSWYEHQGLDVTQNVTHVFQGGNAAACDSTVTLHLRYALFNTVWIGSTTVTYDAQPQAGLGAYYIDDTGRTQQVALTFTNGTDIVTAPNYPVTAGVWTVTARPVLPVDSLIGATTTLTIEPATVYVSGATAETAKFYDGTNAAVVSNPGTLVGVHGSDAVSHTTEAILSDASVGSDKTVTLMYALNGDAALLSNYNLAPTEEVYTTEGYIIEPMVPNIDRPSDDTTIVEQGFDVYAYGYCSGDSYHIRYHLTTGAPDQYKLDFADSRLADANPSGWTALAAPGADGVIDIVVPVDMPMGDYSVTVTFRDSRFTWLESTPMPMTFHVNLPETFTMPLFNNVIALVDTCHCFSDIQWYHRPNASSDWVAIPGATGYYYHATDAQLQGEFFVKAKYNGVETFTCPQADLETLITDTDVEADVDVYPNPTRENVTVRVNNSRLSVHALRVLTTVGVEMENRTFEGESTTIDMSGYQSGTYIVSVDGMIVRIIKN